METRHNWVNRLKKETRTPTLRQTTTRIVVLSSNAVVEEEDVDGRFVVDDYITDDITIIDVLEDEDDCTTVKDKDNG